MATALIDKNRKTSSMDQFILILEISFVFLLVYTLITLFDASINSINAYGSLTSRFLGEQGVGSLNGGQLESIVRITIVFNLLLFTLSLFFGIWMRKTRDDWSFKKMGFTLRTDKYSFKNLIERGLILGFLVIVIHYIIMTVTIYLVTGSFEEAVLNIHTYYTGSDLYSSNQLNAEFYFGYAEMSIIWPMSAGFFFFAYAHNSLAARFSKGIANILSSLFYVYYLLYFFVITEQGKLEILFNPNTWTIPLVVQLVVLLITMYISFSAFGETKSIVLPFLLNFVLNAVLTFFRSFNSLSYSEYTPLMLIPFFISLTIVVGWFFWRRSTFSTLKNGIRDIKFKNIPIKQTIFYSVIFILLSFMVPGILEYFILGESTSGLISLVTGLIYVLIIIIAILVLTYEPTSVYDVILVSKDGRPISSKIEQFETDDVLISGFFTAIGTISTELGAGDSELKSVKRGDKEIIIVEGVLSNVIALVDKDQKSIRDEISQLHQNFEIKYRDTLTEWSGQQFTEAFDLLDVINKLSIRFNISPQTRWIGTLSLVFSPLIIFLLGFVI